ncbi:hypothetical protein J4402_04310 [Candidatus Pacearchaeota archaeon]|nr:hypothetical protein [Candidatus Pacearchaeota archaeon]
MDINAVKEAAVASVLNFYSTLESCIPEKYRIFIHVGFYIIFITIYALFVWKFYRFLAKRDIFKLDLNKYNNSAHPIINKFFKVIFFFLEFLIIFPVIIFFWFGILSLFLLFLSKNQSIDQILLISAGIVGAIRLTAYISEDLSKDLSKMFPFTLLGIFLIDPNFFSIEEFIQKTIQIPLFIQEVFLYLFFIFLIEVIIRLLFTMVTAIRRKE